MGGPLVKFKAFTLIEVLAVIMIIGVLSGLALGPIRSAKLRSRDATRKAELNTIAQAIDLYAAERKALPGSINGVCNVSYSSHIPAEWTALSDQILTYIPSSAGRGLPKDPTTPNTATYHFGYTCSGAGYLLTAVLENKNDLEGTLVGAYRQYRITR